jgi:hypothetical protein
MNQLIFVDNIEIMRETEVKAMDNEIMKVLKVAKVNVEKKLSEP